MTRFSDPAVRRHLLTLKKACDDHSHSLADAERKHEELQDRQSSLRSRINSEGKSQVARDDAAGSDLAQTLADDPNASLVDADLSALVDAEIAVGRAAAARRARVRVLESAAKKLDAPLAAVARQIDGLAHERGKAYGAFIHASHEALANEFARRFVALRDEIIEPMLAMELAHRAVTSGVHVEWGEVITLRTHVGGQRVWSDEQLLRVDEYGLADRGSSAVAVVDAFFAEIA